MPTMSKKKARKVSFKKRVARAWKRVKELFMSDTPTPKKPRVITEAHREKLRQNMAKARAVRLAKIAQSKIAPVPSPVATAPVEQPAAAPAVVEDMVPSTESGTSPTSN